MILQPVLIRIPYLPGLSGPEGVARQREYARMALDHCARLCGAPGGPWPQTDARVPLPKDGFHWSIAHKPRFAGAVIARVSVGIDVEALTPRGRDLSPAVASPAEWAVVQARNPRFKLRPNAASDPAELRAFDWKTFFAVWTAKEAALKSQSTGIGGIKACTLVRIEPGGRFVLTFNDREVVVEHFVYGNHVAAVTAAGARVCWHVVEGDTHQR